MKVICIQNATTHYYNLIVSKLVEVLKIDLIYVCPIDKNTHVGEGVYQTKDGAEFKIIELPLYNTKTYSSFRGLEKLLLNIKPDIVLSYEPITSAFVFKFSLIILKKLLGFKVITNSIPFQLEKFSALKEKYGRVEISNYRGIRKLIPKYILNLLLRIKLLKNLYKRKISYVKTDAHLCYIEDAYEIYQSYGVPKDKIFITYNSPDTDLYFKIKEEIVKEPPILSPNNYRLIHIGRLVKWKRVDLLLQAIQKLKKDFHQIEVYIIGYGPEENSLKALAQELDINERTYFTGGIYDIKLLGKYLMSSSIYVLAGMGGISINDAMCFNLPVICSNCDGTEKKLVREDFNGKYFLEGDLNDLCLKIGYLLSNPEVCKKMGENSVKIIKDEINIHTVIHGYKSAFDFVSTQSFK